MRILIPSLGYGDFLAITLPAWRQVCPDAEIRVVTSCDDRETREVAGRAGATVVVSDAWTHDGAVLNKAAALDQAMGLPPIGTVCLATDADVVPFGAVLDACIERGVVYGCPRYLCLEAETLAAHRAGWIARAALPLILPRRAGETEQRLATGATDAQAFDVARRCLGYCQAFRYQPGLRFGSSQSAGGYDNRFARLFDRRDVVPGGLYVLHLGHQDRTNWTGRVVPRWVA